MNQVLQYVKNDLTNCFYYKELIGVHIYFRNIFGRLEKCEGYFTTSSDCMCYIGSMLGSLMALDEDLPFALYLDSELLMSSHEDELQEAQIG